MHRNLWKNVQIIERKITLLYRTEFRLRPERIDMKMNASDRLMNLNVFLKVAKADKGLVSVRYENCYIIGDNGEDVNVIGYGLDFEEACEKFLSKISGKKLRIYDSCSVGKKIYMEVTVL